MRISRQLAPAVLGFLLVIAAAPSALAQLPFDPSTIDPLTPEQRQKAAELLGQTGNGSAAADGRFRDRGLSSSDDSLRRSRPYAADGAGGTQDADCLEAPREAEATGYAASAGTGGRPAAAAVAGSGRSGYVASGVGDATTGVLRSGQERSAVLGDGSERSGAGAAPGATSADGGRAWQLEMRRRACLEARARRRGDDLIDLDLDSGHQALRPFGYDLFANGSGSFAPATDIPVPSDYVLGPGDTLRVQLFGNENGNYTLQVGRDGLVNFPKLGPISVAGQRFDDARERIVERVGREMIGVQASISLGELRSVRVFLLGDVAQPGSYTVSSLSTITNALFAGGGIGKIGSLRKVQLKRDGRLVRVLDLYALLLHGDSSADERLLPGDVIFVPPAGPRVSIDGEVRRPAIYELNGERSVDEVLSLAGGLLASTNTGLAQIERYEGNRKQVRQLDLAKAGDLASRVQDGDLLRIGSVAARAENRVRVTGFVKYAGPYQWHQGYSLHELLASAQVRPSNSRDEAYLALGLIERSDPASGARNWLGFSVARQLADDAPAFALERDDLVVILSRDDIAYLDSQEVRDVANGVGSGPTGCPALDGLARLVDSERSIRFLKAFNAEGTRDDRQPDEAVKVRQYARAGCPDLFRRVPRALQFLLEESVALYGEVRRPGLYPVAPDTPLALLVQAAGGLTTESDPANIEYLSYQSALKNGHSEYRTINFRDAAGAALAVHPGDLFTFKPLYLGQETGTVRLAGEFRFPGAYGILRGERLSQLIRRAGGITPGAYPYGAVFTRVSARKAEADSYKRAANDLQEAAVTALTSGALGKDASVSAQFLSQITQRLEDVKAVGRVVIEADPVVLEAKPDLDPIVEPGDLLVMPKRPISVTVIGQVLNPGSLAFKPGTPVGQYIERAGGYSQAADKGRVFVILPNGTAEKFKSSFWNFEPRDVPPGSVIVVPRDAAPFNALAFGERVFGVLSSLALTAAALATISRN